MNEYQMQASTSFLLGKIYGSICSIIDCDGDSNYKLKLLDELRFELYNKINSLYYSKFIKEPLTKE